MKYINLLFWALCWCLISCNLMSAEENQQAQPIPEVTRPKPVIPVDTPLTRLALTIGGSTRDGFLAPEELQQISGASEHASLSDKLWRNMVKKIPVMEQWRDEYLSPKLAGNGTLLYPLAGADLLHADVFFPEVDTIIMIGLEPVGEIPANLKDLSGDNSRYFQYLRTSLNYILNFSYFMTKSMSIDFTGKIDGTLSAILHFAVRRDYLISEVKHVYIQADGRLSTQAVEGHRGNAFTLVKDGKPKLIYYFSLNLLDRDMRYGSNNMPGFTEDTPAFQYLKNSGFRYTYVKAGSYLLHNRSFSTLRNLILAQTELMLQDDTGIPLKYFEPSRWNRQAFGVYNRPIAEFAGYLQPDMKTFYQQNQPGPLPFGIGYLSRSGQSNLQLFTRKHGQDDISAVIEAPVPEETSEAETSEASKPRSIPEADERPRPQKTESSVKPDERLSGRYIIGCYAVADRGEAEKHTNKLTAMGLEANYLYIPDYEPGGKRLYRVYVGPFNTKADAEDVLMETVIFIVENAYVKQMN